MDSGQLLYACHQDVHVLRLVGDIRYPLAPFLKQFVEQLFKLGPVKGMLIDLDAAASIDSTNLGQIARIANRLEARGEPRATIVSSREDITEVLLSMGFSDFFDIVEDRPTPGSIRTTQIDATRPPSDDLARVMLEAHEVLMGMNQYNQDQFRDVVALLKRDIGDT